MFAEKITPGLENTATMLKEMLGGFASSKDRGDMKERAAAFSKRFGQANAADLSTGELRKSEANSETLVSQQADKLTNRHGNLAALKKEINAGHKYEGSTLTAENSDIKLTQRERMSAENSDLKLTQRERMGEMIGDRRNNFSFDAAPMASELGTKTGNFEELINVIKNLGTKLDSYQSSPQQVNVGVSLDGAPLRAMATEISRTVAGRTVRNAFQSTQGLPPSE